MSSTCAHVQNGFRILRGLGEKARQTLNLLLTIIFYQPVGLNVAPVPKVNITSLSTRVVWARVRKGVTVIFRSVTVAVVLLSSVGRSGC